MIISRCLTALQGGTRPGGNLAFADTGRQVADAHFYPIRLFRINELVKNGCPLM